TVRSSEKSSTKNAKETYALMWERMYKREFYTLTISEPFDFGKIGISLSVASLWNGHEFIGFKLMYAGEEFDFSNNWGWDVDDMFLLASNGERFKFEEKE